MVVKKKVEPKVEPKVEIPEGMEGKARYKGVPIEEYAERLLNSQSVTNSTTEKISGIERGLNGQGYDAADIVKVVKPIMEKLLNG